MVSLKLGHHLILLLVPDVAFKKNDNRAGITEYVTAL